jgi:uncharacterized protein (TIGR03086 family)
MDDITLLRRAVDDASRIIDGVQADQLDLPTPCPDFTVGQLVAHLAEGMEMFAAASDGSQPAAEPEWKTAGDHVVAAFSRPGALDGNIALPYGEFPAVVGLQQALGETAIHTTDIARATGQALGDDDVYESVFRVVTSDWRVESVLGPEVPCPAGAPLLDRVQAFAGRAI